MTAKEYYFGIEDKLVRGDYWVSGFILPFLLIILAGMLSNKLIVGNVFMIVMSYLVLTITALISLWIFFAITIKRMNFLGINRVYLFLLILPFINILFLIYIGVKKE